MTRSEFDKKLHIIFSNCEEVIQDMVIYGGDEYIHDHYKLTDTPDKVAEELKKRIDGLLDGSSPYQYFMKVEREQFEKDFGHKMSDDSLESTRKLMVISENHKKYLLSKSGEK